MHKLAFLQIILFVKLTLRCISSDDGDNDDDDDDSDGGDDDHDLDT